MTISVGSVATDADLVNELGGAAALANILPADWADAEQARTLALEDVIESLRRRSPPVAENDLANVTQLRRAVTYGALERLYRMAMHGVDDVYAVQRKLYDTRFNAEVAGLSPLLLGGARGSVGSIGIARR
jgi:hypothetical protein